VFYGHVHQHRQRPRIPLGRIFWRVTWAAGNHRQRQSGVGGFRAHGAPRDVDQRLLLGLGFGGSPARLIASTPP
jgi:hypothetical protein